MPPQPPDSPAFAAAAWLAVLPTAVVVADRQGRVRWANAAATALVPSLVAGAALETALALDAALAAATADVGGGELHVGAAGASIGATSRRAPDDGLLLTLRRLQAGPATPDPDDPHTLLEIACAAGQLGRFERDLRTGRGRWNRAMFAMRGLDGDEGEAPLIDEVHASVVAADREAYVDWIREILSRPGRHRFRYHVRAPSGQIRSLRCECLVVAGPDGRAERAVGFEVDDTVVSSLGPAHETALSQIAMASELTRIIVWSHDLVSDRVYYSPRATEVLGLPPAPDGLPGATLRELVHPEDRPKIQRQIDEASATGQPVDTVVRYWRVDGGGWRSLLMRRAVERDADGRPAALLGVSLDITDRVEESRRAEEMGRRFELALEAGGIGCWTLEPNSQQASWNQRLREMNGLPPGEPVPSNEDWLERFVHPGDRDALRQRMQDWLAGDEPRLEAEFRVVRPDGSVRRLNAHCNTGALGAGSAFGLVFDVTDRRAAEEVRHERALALRENQARSRFLSRMSHELRTPLNAVIGFAELLLADPDGDAALRCRRLEAVRTAGAQLLALVDDVLDVAAMDGGEMRIASEDVELAPLVRETLDSVEPLRAAGEIGIECGPLDAAVVGDALRLRQVLQNLLTNAIKYNRRGGSVRVHARRDADAVRLFVEDTGRGMDREQLRGLFVPFNRLGAEREAIPGTGIGLVIVKGLVERMGGSIEVRSTPGRGTVVELRLRAADTPVAPAARGPACDAAAGATGAGGATLLYIEDNPVNAQILVEFVARRGDLRIEVVDTGAAGVRRAAELQPQVVLLDMQLPDIDGHEVLRRLRADPLTARIPVVALSANAMPQDISAALAAGMAGYWTKPLDFRAFLASLDALIDATA